MSGSHLMLLGAGGGGVVRLTSNGSYDDGDINYPDPPTYYMQGYSGEDYIVGSIDDNTIDGSTIYEMFEYGSDGGNWTMYLEVSGDRRTGFFSNVNFDNGTSDTDHALTGGTYTGSRTWWEWYVGTAHRFGGSNTTITFT